MSQIAKRIADRKRHRLLLGSLSNCCTDPCKNDVVDTKAEAYKEVDAEHPRTQIQSRDSDNETNHDDAFANGDV